MGSTAHSSCSHWSHEAADAAAEVNSFCSLSAEMAGSTMGLLDEQVRSVCVQEIRNQQGMVACVALVDAMPCVPEDLVQFAWMRGDTAVTTLQEAKRSG